MALFSNDAGNAGIRPRPINTLPEPIHKALAEVAYASRRFQRIVAYSATGGITFTFGGLKIDDTAQVIATDWRPSDRQDTSANQRQIDNNGKRIATTT